MFTNTRDIFHQFGEDNFILDTMEFIPLWLHLNVNELQYKLCLLFQVYHTFKHVIGLERKGCKSCKEKNFLGFTAWCYMLWVCQDIEFLRKVIRV